MKATILAEWRKLVTIRTFLWLIVAAAAVTAVGAVSTISASTERPWHMPLPLHDQTAWMLGTINGGIFAIIVGGRTFTDEFRHRTLAHTYIADPARTRSTLAKAAVAGIGGGLVGGIVVTALLLVALTMALLSGGTVRLHAGDVPAAAGLISAMGLWGVLGAAFGAVARSQVAVVAGGLIWVLMLENLGAGLLGDDAGRYLPGQAVHAMARTSDQAVNLMSPGTATVLLLLYAAAFIALAGTILRRRDIV